SVDERRWGICGIKFLDYRAMVRRPHPKAGASEKDLGLGTDGGLHLFMREEDFSLVVEVRDDPARLGDSPREQGLGERILDEALDRATQGTRAVGGRVAFLAELVLEAVGDHQLELVLAHPLVDLLH